MISDKAGDQDPMEKSGRSSSLARVDTGMASLSLPPAAEYDEGLMLAEDWTTVISDGASVANGQRALSSVSSTRDADLQHWIQELALSDERVLQRRASVQEGQPLGW